MATQSAVLKFALPEDEESDQMRIYSSATKEGTYTLATTVSYEYGISTYEYDELDDTLWYKIQFHNTDDGESGPLSDPVYGGTFDNASPFLAVSTAYDGAHYATTQDVYDYSSLTTVDVSVSRVSQALRRARAVIDLKTADLNLNRFNRTFSTDVARKKHNATLRIVKEAEINIALGNIYRGLSDDLVMDRLRDALSGASIDSESVSIGQTALAGSSGLANPRHMAELNSLANRYLAIGAAMLNALQPPSVRMHYLDDDDGGFSKLPRFRFPFNGV
jgi:hypothetical protein